MVMVSSKRNKNIFFVALLLMLISSCGQKHEKTIAVGVLLTLPKEVYEQALLLNRALLQSNPTNITLDEKHIPHITLLQAYVYESDLPAIEKKLDKFYKSIKKDTLAADRLQYNPDKKESFASIGIKRTASLMTLHEEIISQLEPYILTKGSQEAYVPNVDGTAIDDFTLAYVPKFVEAHSHDHYDPHISLGVAPTTVLDSLATHQFHPMSFRAKGLGIYQLGAFGTAQNPIWISE